MTRDELMKEIVKLVYVKQAIAKEDIEHRLPHHFPRVAVRDSDIADIERGLGESLNPGYRTFLSLAGGWPGFWHDADLFGPLELRGGGVAPRATELVSNLEPVVLAESKIERDEVSPICASNHDMDVFVIGRPSSSIAGVVIWFASAEIERFQTFDDFFAAMIDYNRSTYQRMAKLN